jgi:uncharacterized protein (TIGR03083 family)
MERSRLLQCLAADYLQLRTVASTGLNAQVPTCPGWTVTDLVRHVGQVYLHKAEVMHTGAWPDPWPPAETATEPPIALLDRGYAAVTHAFSRRGDTDRSVTWHAPDQTVKFWIRRMAQETVIHRLDAELAMHSIEPDPVPDDLAVDGIDEVLRLFLAYEVEAWPEEFTDAFAGVKPCTVRVATTGSAAAEWLVRIGEGTVAIGSAGAGDGIADGVVQGGAEAVLRWLWGRELTPLAVEGDAVAVLRKLLVAGQQ